jgi:hypothetical protein
VLEVGFVVGFYVPHRNMEIPVAVVVALLQLHYSELEALAGDVLRRWLLSVVENDVAHLYIVI